MTAPGGRPAGRDYTFADWLRGGVESREAYWWEWALLIVSVPVFLLMLVGMFR